MFTFFSSKFLFNSAFVISGQFQNRFPDIFIGDNIFLLDYTTIIFNKIASNYFFFVIPIFFYFFINIHDITIKKTLFNFIVNFFTSNVNFHFLNHLPNTSNKHTKLEIMHLKYNLQYINQLGTGIIFLIRLFGN